MRKIKRFFIIALTRRVILKLRLKLKQEGIQKH